MKALTQRPPNRRLPIELSISSVVKPDRFPSFRLWLLIVILLCGGGKVSGAGGTVTQKLGSPIPNSSVPGGFQLASLKVIIEPAAARTAGATWLLKGGTTQLASGSSVLKLVPDAGIPVLQFSTVTGFQVPVQPRVTLTGGFETAVTFTYARTLPPELPATATAAGTRAVAFAYSPRVTGGAATSFLVSVGGGETLATLGLVLNSASGRLSGIPTKIGTFNLVVTATNTAGSSQPMALTLTVTDPGQLTVQADATRGSVTVSPNRAGNLFPQSDTVVLTAKPKTPDFLFNGWQFTGATPTSLTTLTTSFMFSPTKLVVVATPSFIPNPFLNLVDSYEGRVAPESGVTLTNTGTLLITVTNLGKYTGKLKLGTGTYNFKGQFQNDGTAAPLTIQRPAPLVDLVIDQLQLDLAGGELITGRITTDRSFLFTLDRNVFDTKTHPCPQSATDPKTGKPVAAHYTLVLQRDPAKAADLFPQGHGVGAVTVNPDGKVRFTGTLGDGTTLTQSGVISRAGRWPFHALLYKSGGLISGDLIFRDLASASDLDGTLDWIKPALAGATITYPGGFTTQTAVLGSRYDKSVPLLSGRVSFGEGNLATVLNPIPITNAAGLLIASPPVSGFSLQLTASTGLFKGNLPAAASVSPLKFQGVIFQKSPRGYGWFVGAPLPAGQGLPTGYVELAIP